MTPQFALMLVPLIIWTGVFAFVFSVDRRVRALERLIERQAPRETTQRTTATLSK